MSTLYSYNIASDFPDGQANIGKLRDEITISLITIALDYITAYGGTVYIYFKASLPAGDKTTLDGDTTGPAGGLIALHDNSPDAPEELPVVIQEESTKTNGKFQFSSFYFNAAGGTTTTYDKSFPFAISVLDFWWITDLEDRGDAVDLCVGPNTTTGAITADVTASDTVINVQKTVIDNTYPGDTINLTDGTNTDNALKVIFRNTANNTLTLDTGPANSYAAATPTYVQSTVHIVTDVEIGREGKISVGTGKIGASHIPANVVIQTRWTNKHPVEAVGLLTVDASTNDTVISVDQACIDDFHVNDHIGLNDGTNTSDLGFITTINHFNKVLTVATAVSQNFASATPTHVEILGKHIVGYVEYLR